MNAEVIKRMLTIFEKNRFPSKLREMAQTVLIASNQAMSLANDLLDQEFIKKGQFVPEYSCGSIPDAISEIVTQVRLTLVRKDLKIKSDLAFTRHVFPILQFDKRRLQQVLLNLLLNAVKFQQSGKITIDVQIVADGVDGNAYTLEVSVLDQGIGMTDAQAMHVFDPLPDSSRRSE